MKTNNETLEIIGNLTDNELIAATEDFSKDIIPSDSILRELSLEIYDKCDLITILSLGVPISQNLARRLERHIKK